MSEPILPPDATIPDPPHTDSLWLEPLRQHHNEADLAAWSASIDHIRSTPGMGGRRWPPDGGYTAEENLADMRMHEDDFAARRGFTYTVLDPATRDVIGCVYLYPAGDGGRPGQVSIRSWVRADKAGLDVELYRLVSDWVAAEWPWTDVVYAPRS